MTNTIFTIEDIKEFLLKNNLKWTGFIYNDVEFSKTLATIEDFKYSEHSTVVMEIENELAHNSFVDMFITNFSFLTYTADHQFMENGIFQSVDKVLTKKWQQFLLNRHKEKYAKLLFDWCIDNMTAIETETKEKIHNFSIKEKEKANSASKQYNDSAKLAMSYLPEEYLQSLDNELNL